MKLSSIKFARVLGAYYSAQTNVLLVALPDDVKCCNNAVILLILLILALFTENLEIFFAEDHQQAILYPMSTVFTGQGGPVYDSIASLFAVHRHTHTQTGYSFIYIDYKQCP